MLVYVTTYLFTHYDETHRVDSMPSLAVQRCAVDVFMTKQGVDVFMTKQGADGGMIDAALADLSRPNVTVAHLDGLPR